MTDNSRCLQSRYSKGYSNHKAEVSGVVCKVLNKDFKHPFEAVYDVGGGR